MAAGDVKLALVGYGRIAPKHLEVLRAQGAAVVASANRSEAGRARAKNEGGIERTYASIAEMLERERPDGVVVTASFPEIYTCACALIPFGLPVLLEKPPGTSVKELDTLVALAHEHRAPAMIALNRRHYSVLANAVADAGGREEISGVFVEWSEDPSAALARFTKDQVARYTFANSLHGLDLLTHLAGPLTTPSIATRTLGDEPFRWIGALQGVSTRGVLASFQSSWDAPGRWRLSFTAKNRRYVFAPLEACTVLEKGNVERKIDPHEHDMRFKAGFYEQARVFLEAIKTRTVPAEHALASARPAMELAEKLTTTIR